MSSVLCERKSEKSGCPCGSPTELPKGPPNVRAGPKRPTRPSQGKPFCGRRDRRRSHGGTVLSSMLPKRAAKRLPVAPGSEGYAMINVRHVLVALATVGGEGGRACDLQGGGELIPRRRCAPIRGTGSSCSPTANRMTHALWQGAGALCCFCIVEAPRLWFAVCSPANTAGHRPGGKMPPGGGSVHSRVGMTARSSSGLSGWAVGRDGRGSRAGAGWRGS
jgi:hypothetical protein